MIVPILNKGDDVAAIMKVVDDVFAWLKEAGVRVHVDDRENYNPGFKYNHWELRGVPIRIEVGKKDVEKQEVRVVRRDNGSK